MYRSPAAGNLRAKTGTIEDASALTGLVQTRDGEHLAFSILVNGTPSTTRAKRVEDAIGIRLARLRRGAGPSPSRTAQLPPPEESREIPGPIRHRVSPGESFSTIARRYGLTVDELLRANPRVEPRRLRAGSWIRVPAAGR